MDFLKEALDNVLSLGSSAVLPLVITVLGLIMGQGLKKSFRAGVITGIGFVGIGLVFRLLISSLGNATKAFIEHTGTDLDIIDIGWSMGASISFGNPLAALLIPTALLVNVLMLSLNQTKTMDIDLWNYWHFIYAGTVAYYALNSIVLGIVVTVLTAIVTYKLADWTAPVVTHYFGLKGNSLPHSETINWAPITFALNKILDKIPGINKINFNEKTLRKRLGVFGEPLFIGFAFGVAMGFLARYDIKHIIILAIQMVSILFIIPKMVALLMEGLIPLSEGIRDFIMKKFPGKEVHIGLDAAVVIGKPSNMVIALLMVPITIVLAIVLPYNRMLPFIDLSVLPFTVIWAVAAARGNLFRALINAIAVLAVVLYLATQVAPATTEMGRAVGFILPEDTNLISGIDIGSHLLPWIFIKILDFANIKGVIYALAALVLYSVLWFWVRKEISKQYAAEIAEELKEVEKKSVEAKSSSG